MAQSYKEWFADKAVPKIEIDQFIQSTSTLTIISLVLIFLLLIHRTVPFQSLSHLRPGLKGLLP